MTSWHFLTEALSNFFLLLPRYLGKLFGLSNPMLFLGLAAGDAVLWLSDNTRCCTELVDVEACIIPPEPFWTRFIVCSITWSGGNIMNFPRDCLIEKFKLLVNWLKSYFQLLLTGPVISKVLRVVYACLRSHTL